MSVAFGVCYLCLQILLILSPQSLKNVCKVNMHQIVVKSGLFWLLSLLWEVAAESKFIGSAFLSMVL